MFDDFHIPLPKGEIGTQLQRKIDNKTKPFGALGELEHLALQLGVIQQTLTPRVDKPKMILFAADHGVVDQGVSAFPQQVTEQMVMNFVAGGAAVSVFCRQNQVPLEIVDVGVNATLVKHPLISDRKVALASQDYSLKPAMSADQCQQAIQAGVDEVNNAIEQGVNLLMFGEMGIGNTCVSSGLMSVLLNMPVVEAVGRGTGLDQAGVEHKANVIAQSIARAEQHTGRNAQSWSIQTLLEQLGGFEIIAMMGAMLQSAKRGVAFVVDGFICSVAFMLAKQVSANVAAFGIFAHQSNEQAHQRLLTELKAEPILSLNLRLGEGSGAILAYPLIQSACLFLEQMASFDDAGVSKG
ncbi:nicotinate-nucleotide--dimethylbenzimidazole phosphoribosyltransferase [Marinomonas epiphytica]